MIGASVQNAPISCCIKKEGVYFVLALFDSILCFF